MALCLCSLAPLLAPRDIVSRANVWMTRPTRRPDARLQQVTSSSLARPLSALCDASRRPAAAHAAERLRLSALSGIPLTLIGTPASSRNECVA